MQCRYVRIMNIFFGSTLHPLTVESEGLVLDPLQKMYCHPGGDCYSQGEHPKSYYAEPSRTRIIVSKKSPAELPGLYIMII